MKRPMSQPRIANVRRMPSFSSLHPAIRAGADEIARSEGKSVSYVISELLSALFGVAVDGERTNEKAHISIKSRRVVNEALRKGR